MTPGEWSALRALRDCGVIRAHPETAEWRGLRRRGLVFTTEVPGTGRRDFRLSSMGRETAAQLPRIVTGRNYP